MRTARAKRGVRRASSTIRPSGAHPICSASVALTTAMRLGCCHRGVARTSAAREPHRRNLKRANARGVRRRDRSTPAGAPLRSQRKHHSMVTRRALRRRRPVVCVRPALLLGIPTAIVHSRHSQHCAACHSSQQSYWQGAYKWTSSVPAFLAMQTAGMLTAGQYCTWYSSSRHRTLYLSSTTTEGP